MTGVLIITFIAPQSAIVIVSRDKRSVPTRICASLTSLAVL